MEINKRLPPRKDGRVIIHFDYDCFYAAVFETQNPALRSVPFAVQQKHIIVTCNYEARRRGLHKLQLIRDAKRICPDVVIELGEDISRFRDASKELYAFIRQFSWSGKVERLGFDEVWLDVTDAVEYNVGCLNRCDLRNSFFQTKRDDPTVGFGFDASVVAGYVYPKPKAENFTVKLQREDEGDEAVALRLTLASHFATHIRHRLEEERGYTSTVGVATNKLLSKLVGNVNKPKGQTTLMPPLNTNVDDGTSNVLSFLDDHEIGKIPGIGFKLAQKLRQFYLQRPATFEPYGGAKESVTVGSIRNHPDVCPEMLEKLLAGPGSPHGIGVRVWCLMHGIDDVDVGRARDVPTQISVEDSYIRLDTAQKLLEELTALARSLLKRMRIDLLGTDEFDDGRDGDSPAESGVALDPSSTKRWLAHPRTLRLTTRPRQPLQREGTRVRAFKRISHSGPLPNFVFNLHDSIDALAERLVRECLGPMFRKLHPERTGWDLSLVNLAVTNMAEAAGESKTAKGRDIGNMFRRQDDVLRDFRVVEPLDHDLIEDCGSEEGTEDNHVDHEGMHSEDDVWLDNDDDDEIDSTTEVCMTCGADVPVFAMLAHRRFHSPDVS